MNKNNASTITYMKVAIVSVVALFGALFALIPASAHADYYYPYDTTYSYQTSYVNYNGTNYYPTGSQSGYYVSGYSYQTPIAPLVVSCNATASYAPVGSGVTWVANVSGGNGAYTYSWNGTDGLYGSQSTAYIYYNNPGIKTATLYVTSYGQQRAVQCSNSVTVGGPTNVVYNNIYQIPPTTVYNTPVYQTPVATNQGIQIACFADTVSTKVGVPVTWAVEATGAGENFTYAWTGSDGLSGNQSSVITTYTSTGLKSAVVTATSASGRSQSKACGNTVTVKSAYTATSVAKAPTPATVVPAVPNNNLSAAALFSLQYVPWGLVAVLVIIILFITVLYLIFNRKKI